MRGRMMWAGFWEVILDTCLHCRAVDAACEGTRAGYMLELVTHLPDAAFYTDSVLESLPQGGDDWDEAQRFHFATYLAMEGDERAKRLVYENYRPGPRHGECSSRGRPAKVVHSLSMGSLPQCFVAYPSSPASRAETVELAIETISRSDVVCMRGWKTILPGGRLIISRVFDEIRACDCLVADLTGLNPNVLFELGYALAHRKKLWILLDTSIEKAKSDFDRFQLFSTVGYRGSSNSDKIVEGFYNDQPYAPGPCLYDDLLEVSKRPMRPTLVYLKAHVATEASNRLTRRVMAGQIASVIDDPAEGANQPLSWYVNRVEASSAVVCHLLSSDHVNWQLHNAKQAFVAGMAHGLGKPLLMLAHSPYSSPLDYKDLLRVCDTAVQAETLFNEWFAPVAETVRVQESNAEYYKNQAIARSTLEKIDLGEMIAENESEYLANYFIPTAAYNEALHANHSIFVGRKGTGKSATFYKLQDELSKDVRNHVCIIKPVAYELEGVVLLLSKTLNNADSGYLIESLWKFLINTELAKSLFTQINYRPVYYGRTAGERDLVEFVEQNTSWIMPEFSIRLESAVSKLMALPETGTVDSRRKNISEKLHGDMLPRLKTITGNLISGKNRVVILVDNLDKAWDQTQDLTRVSELLFGLLSVSNRIATDFERDATFRGKCAFSLILFLRSDIYAAIIRFAHERDKIPVRRMSWDDPAMLLRVLEERFIKSDLDCGEPEEIWQRFFSATVRNRTTRQYLAETVLPRPRDLLYLVKTALQFAINRNHGRIEEEDLLSAEVEYSRFALNSLMAENAGQIQSLERLLTQFSLSSEIITELDLLGCIERAGVIEQPSDVAEFLCELAFLGMEVEPNRFEYLYDEADTAKLRAMASRGAEQNPQGLRRYRINRAYHRYLEVKPGADLNQQAIEV